METPGTSRYRWTICALLFYATTLNYLDRQILSILAPILQRGRGWSEARYGYVITSFQVAYGILFPAVRSPHRYHRDALRLPTFGGDLGLVVAVPHYLVRTGRLRSQPVRAREAGNFPVAIKTVGAVLPRHQRSFATGLFNSGSNIGAIIAPALVPWLAARFGWRSCFRVTAAIGLIWLVLWFLPVRSVLSPAGGQPTGRGNAKGRVARHPAAEGTVGTGRG
jgi:MFS transporter, ACS family, hexuronate transporter